MVGGSLTDNGCKDIRLVGKWMRKIERSSLTHTLRGDKVVGKMVLSKVEEKMEEEKDKD